jgi:MscS family membrane protein
MRIRLPRPTLWLVSIGLTLAGLFAGPAAAQPQLPSGVPANAVKAPEPGQVAAPEPAAEAPDSPRASVRSFLELTGKGRNLEAARYLSLDGSNRDRGPVLAERLRAVLDRYVNVDVDALSPLSEGDLNDRLPAGTEGVGTVPNQAGGTDHVYLVRVRSAQGDYWAFSPRTVAHIDEWYDSLEDRWIRDLLPPILLRHGPRGLLWWQWLALPVLFVISLVIGRILGAITRAILQQVSKRTPTKWDDRILARVAPAVTLLWAVAVGAALLPSLALVPAAHRFVWSLLGASAMVSIFFGLWRSADVWVQFLLERPWAVDNPSARSMLAVGGNLLKVLVVVVGVLATIAAFGYSVTTVLAGVGIGGVALAFGAQKTVENLFGSLALAADQPLRVGDFVRVDDFVGTVERIGMRSTQIRTLDRTLISIPNGQLSDKRIESFAARDRIRFAATIGVVYGTTHAQMDRVLKGLESVLRSHPRIWPDTVVVRFAGFGPSSLDIEVMCWFQTTDYDEFRALREEALLGFMRVVEEAGTGFAFPTRTVHIVSEDRPSDRTPPIGPA